MSDTIREPFPFTAWVRAHLPADLPEDVITGALQPSGDLRGLEVWFSGSADSPSHEVRLYAATDEDDLRRWVFERACDRIAGCLVDRELARELRRWRYVPVGTGQGGMRIREQAGYDYDAVYNRRKHWGEHHLRLIRGGVSAARFAEVRQALEAMLNADHPEPHWRYDEAREAFIEVSRRHPRTPDGRDWPTPEMILPPADPERAP